MSLKRDSFFVKPINLEGEFWRPISDYEKLFMGSNFGRIKNIERFVNSNLLNGVKSVLRREKILVSKPNKDGYLKLSIRLDRSGLTSASVHRLIAKTFIPNPENHPMVNHKNGIKDDNRIENLEWCNNQYNIKHAFANGLMNPMCGEKHSWSKLTEKEVLDIRRLRTEQNIEYSKIAKTYNVTRGNIYNIVKRISWKHV